MAMDTTTPTNHDFALETAQHLRSSYMLHSLLMTSFLWNSLVPIDNFEPPNS